MVHVYVGVEPEDGKKPTRHLNDEFHTLARMETRHGFNARPSPDELLQDVQPPNPRGVVQRGAAVMTTSVGIGPSFKEDAHAVKVAVDDGDIERRLAFNVHQVHLCTLGDQVGHAGSVSCCGCDPQRGAGQTPTAPHRLLINTPGREELHAKVHCAL